MWRLILASIFFLLSLLTVFKAPTNFLWKVAVAITEFPYIPLIITVIFIICNIKAGNYKLYTLILSITALGFYLSPVVRAYNKAAYVSQHFSSVFQFKPSPAYLQKPYSFIKMFRGMSSDKITPQVLIYKNFQSTKLTLDFYASANTVKAPCVIVVHGGSWSAGDSKQLPHLNSYLAKQGYHVAAINYRLAPQYKSPAQVQDTKEAIAWLKKQSGILNIDTANFIILGRSAGAQIALVAAYSLNDPNIKGAISLYGPADMVWGGRIKGNKWVLNTDKVFDNYLGGSIDQVPEKFKESSACEYVTSASPPTLVIHGENDALVSFGHSVHLTEKLSKAGVKHYFLNLPWATHGCDFNDNGPSGQLSTYVIERFLNSVVVN